MRWTIAILSLSALALAGARADEPPAKKTECRCERREVGASGSKKDWSGYGKGVVFHTSVDEARAMAREQGKLVYVFHLIGDLDKEGC